MHTPRSLASSTYIGETKNGTKHGKGEQTYSDGSKFIGIFCNDKRIWGTYIWVHGELYEGGWDDEKMHGRGKFKYSNRRTYKGEWQHGKKSGFGRFEWENGDYYDGQFLNDHCHGYGIMHYSDGRVFRGNWANNKINGIGSLILKNGDEIKAVFDGNRITGRGMLTKPDSRSFIVDFEDSKILKSSVPFYLNGIPEDFVDNEIEGSINLAVDAVNSISVIVQQIHSIYHFINFSDFHKLSQSIPPEYMNPHSSMPLFSPSSGRKSNSYNANFRKYSHDDSLCYSPPSSPHPSSQSKFNSTSSPAFARQNALYSSFSPSTPSNPSSRFQPHPYPTPSFVVTQHLQSSSSPSSAFTNSNPIPHAFQHHNAPHAQSSTPNLSMYHSYHSYQSFPNQNQYPPPPPSQEGAFYNTSYHDQHYPNQYPPPPPQHPNMQPPYLSNQQPIDNPSPDSIPPPLLINREPEDHSSISTPSNNNNPSVPVSTLINLFTPSNPSTPSNESSLINPTTDAATAVQSSSDASENASNTTTPVSTLIHLFTPASHSNDPSSELSSKSAELASQDKPIAPPLHPAALSQAKEATNGSGNIIRVNTSNLSEKVRHLTSIFENPNTFGIPPTPPPPSKRSSKTLSGSSTSHNQSLKSKSDSLSGILLVKEDHPSTSPAPSKSEITLECLSEDTPCSNNKDNSTLHEDSTYQSKSENNSLELDENKQSTATTTDTTPPTPPTTTDTIPSTPPLPTNTTTATATAPSTDGIDTTAKDIQHIKEIPVGVSKEYSQGKEKEKEKEDSESETNDNQTDSTTAETSKSTTTTPIGSKNHEIQVEEIKEKEKEEKKEVDRGGVAEIENNETSKDATISKSTLLSMLIPDNDDQIKETIKEITASLHSQESNKNLSKIISSLETANFNLENLDRLEANFVLAAESPKSKEAEKQEKDKQATNKAQEGSSSHPIPLENKNSEENKSEKSKEKKKHKEKSGTSEKEKKKHKEPKKKENKSEKSKEKSKNKKGEEEEREAVSEEAGKSKKTGKVEGGGKKKRGMTTGGGSGGILGAGVAPANMKASEEMAQSSGNKEPVVPLRRPKRKLPISHSEMNANLRFDKREDILRRIKEVNGEHASQRHSTVYAVGKSSGEFSKQLASQYEDSTDIFSPKDQKKKIQKKISVDHDLEIHLKKEKEDLKKRGSRKPRSHIVNSSSSSNFNDPSSFSAPLNDSNVLIRDIDPTKKKKRFQIQSLSFRNVFS